MTSVIILKGSLLNTVSYAFHFHYNQPIVELRSIKSYVVLINVNSQPNIPLNYHLKADELTFTDNGR